MRAERDLPQPSINPGRPVPPFARLFDGGTPSVPTGALLDLPSARRWFDLLRWGASRGLYTYQQPLDGRSGPVVSVHGREYLMLSSYDYLGFLGDAEIEAAALATIRIHGTGTGGVRLLTGTTALHQQLERELAGLKECEAALTVGSGYAANLAVIPALFGPGDCVVVDAFAHRSIIDACHVARTQVRRFRHNDPESLELELRRSSARRTLIVIEGVYSMEGDIGVLPAIAALKRRFGAFLMVDEAHAIGTIGARGCGVDEHFGTDGDAVDIWTGSLSKALASNGGFVAGSLALITYLQHAAAPYIFSAALCPAAAGAALAALRVMTAEPQRLQRLARNTRRLRHGLNALGFDTGSSSTPVIPVILGDDARAYAAARHLLDAGILATAVVQPAVPKGAARLRLCATAAHSDHHIAQALEAFAHV